MSLATACPSRAGTQYILEKPELGYDLFFVINSMLSPKQAIPSTSKFRFPIGDGTISWSSYTIFKRETFTLAES